MFGVEVGRLVADLQHEPPASHLCGQEDTGVGRGP